MNHLALYGGSLALLNDLYQLTMAYGYWKEGLAERRACFHLTFRREPFDGGFALACGLETALEWIERFSFAPDDVDYLATLSGSDGQPLFESGFLQYLRDLKLSVDMDAIPEGEVVFGREPLLRVQGPVLQCQLLETALLTIINFQTLIATKASRVCLSARGQQVLEFGARRAQGIDGALAASRAAYVGGCASTSNVLAGKIWGIPVKGTHAHSWVMLFEDELEAFAAYARAMPNNCTFLVDTYDTLEGVRHAVQIGQRLREQGHEMNGIRLDSGDLAYLSIEARKILDAAGFEKTNIVASNDLDEHLIESLKGQGAAITVWGVGTRLVTGGDQAALGGVYKLSAIQNEGGEWQPRLKLSEQIVKISDPGILQVRRYFRQDALAVNNAQSVENIADAIYDERADLSADCTIIDPEDITRRKTLSQSTLWRDLLVPVFRQGARVYAAPPIEEVRQRAAKSLNEFHPGIKRFVNPHAYPVGLESSLHRLKTELILEARRPQRGAADDAQK